MQGENTRSRSTLPFSPGQQGGPLMHVIAGKAVSFKEALEPKFLQYQKQVLKNAKALSSALIERGFSILTGRHGQPSDACRPE